jgi:predicted transcriptional regulator
MVRRPAVHQPSTTLAQLRAFFRDDHVHMALLVDGDKLVGTVERGDLDPQLSGEASASSIARLDGRTIRVDADVREAFESMRHAGRRRLAVTADDSTLLGLLCLKASGRGFCSDADVGSRKGAPAA